MFVYIIGAISCDELDLRNYAKKHFNMSEENLIIVKDYNKIKNFNFLSLKNHSEISDVIFSALPHSAGKHGQYASMMQKMRCEEGYPNIIQVRNMKLTISAFKKAMLESRYLRDVNKNLHY